MSEQVRVDDLEVFRRFRVALLKFAQAASQAIGSADTQISRTHSWLENEQLTYWQNQLRKRTEDVTRAREAVRQKKVYKDFSGRTRGAIEEEKILDKCLAAVEEAQCKLEATRKWIPKLERAADMYRGGVSRLNSDVTSDIPRAVALLDRLALSLEHYLQIESTVASAPSAAVATTPAESMSRGGELTEIPLAPLRAAPSQDEPEKEAPHVP